MRQPVLSLRHIGKSFPGVRALDDVSIDFCVGEVHGIVGENGAGKSTLMKILSGVYSLDEGEIYFDGEKAFIKNPKDAQMKGQSIIFQEFNLVNALSIAENIFLDRLANKSGTWIDWERINSEADELLRQVGCDKSATTLVSELSVAQKQLVEIAKAISFHSRIVIMDEPTAALTTKEVENLFRIVENLKAKGTTIIYISHKLEEIFTLCDRVTVMRDGCVISTRPISEVTRSEMIKEMVGREMNQEYPRREKKNFEDASVVLNVQNLTRKGVFEDISFALHKGEVLGIAGLVGSGRTEILRAIFGADPVDDGTICINGEPVHIKNPKDAIRNGIAFLTEDRKQQGLLLQLQIDKNISAANLNEISRYGFLNFQKEKTVAQQFVERIRIKTPSIKQKALFLSGGNQQKVVFSKWLFTDSDILMLDEPTRGIDVGAKVEIYNIINDLAAEDKSIILVSSDLPELLAMSDRLIVVYDGKVKGELRGEGITADHVMSMILSKGETADE